MLRRSQCKSSNHSWGRCSPSAPASQSHTCHTAQSTYPVLHKHIYTDFPKFLLILTLLSLAQQIWQIYIHTLTQLLSQTFSLSCESFQISSKKHSFFSRYSDRESQRAFLISLELSVFSVMLSNLVYSLSSSGLSQDLHLIEAPETSGNVT